MSTIPAFLMKCMATAGLKLMEKIYEELIGHLKKLEFPFQKRFLRKKRPRVAILRRMRSYQRIKLRRRR